MRRKLKLLDCFRWTLFVAVLAAAGTVQAQLYWRLDSGYSKSLKADVKDSNLVLICGDPACNTPGTLDKDVGSSTILSGGVGSRFSSNMRADVTLGYRGGYKIDASDQGVPAARFRADVKSLALMVNGYHDFSLAASTPYLGAGLGFAHNKVGTVSFDDGAGFRGSVPGGTKSGFAWALMAGVGIPISGSLTLDIGYRFIELGKIETATGDVIINGAVVPPPYPGATGKLKAHELTIGLRF